MLRCDLDIIQQLIRHIQFCFFRRLHFVSTAKNSDNKKGDCESHPNLLITMVIREGLEPWTQWLKVLNSCFF